MKLGFRNELAAISDPEVRKGRYDELVAAAYERGRALNAGVSFAFDDVIDPAYAPHHRQDARVRFESSCTHRQE